MKKYVRKEKEEGVSPVIATILMVAITVVLAATLYLMVGNMNQTTNQPVAGSLSYVSDVSDPANGKATFEIVLNTPSNPKTGDVSMVVMDSSGNVVTANMTATLQHVVTSSDTTHVRSGDRIQIVGTAPNGDVHGYQVIVSISGYSGTITGTVPS